MSWAIVETQSDVAGELHGGVSNQTGPHFRTATAIMLPWRKPARRSA